MYLTLFLKSNIISLIRTTDIKSKWDFPSMVKENRNWEGNNSKKHMLLYTVSILSYSDMNALKENKFKNWKLSLLNLFKTSVSHTTMLTTGVLYIVSIHTKRLHNFHMSYRLCQTNLCGQLQNNLFLNYPFVSVQK